MLRNLILAAATMMGLARAEVKHALMPRIEVPTTLMYNHDRFKTKSERSRKRPLAARGRWAVRVARLRGE